MATALPSGGESNLWMPFACFVVWFSLVWLLDRRIRPWPTPVGVLLAIATAIGIIATAIAPGVSELASNLLRIAFVAAIVEIVVLYLKERETEADRRLALSHKAAAIFSDLFNVVREAVGPFAEWSAQSMRLSSPEESEGLGSGERLLETQRRYDQAGNQAHLKYFSHYSIRINSFLEELAKNKIKPPEELLELVERLSVASSGHHVTIAELEDLACYFGDLATSIRDGK